MTSSTVFEPQPLFLNSALGRGRWGAFVALFLGPVGLPVFSTVLLVAMLRAPLIAASNGDFPGLGDLIYTAPLGYNLNGPYNANGTMRITIGRWFSSMPLFVIKDLTVNFSRATQTNHTPLTCSVQVTFQAFRHLTLNELRAMIRGPAPYIDTLEEERGMIENQLDYSVQE